MALTDGNANGSAGCNTYNAPYELGGTSISFGTPATTRMACPEPPGVMDQENQYLTELQNIEEFSIQEDGLQMFGSASPVTLFYDSVVMGTVGFMQPLEIPSGSTLTVQLQDTSLQDVAAIVLGETVITDFLVIPIPFSVSYDPTDIDTSFIYSISARITDGAGNLIFINTTAYNVITNGSPSVVEVIVEPV
jgi:putative lipoprotein